MSLKDLLEVRVGFHAKMALADEKQAERDTYRSTCDDRVHTA